MTEVMRSNGHRPVSGADHKKTAKLEADTAGLWDLIAEELTRDTEKAAKTPSDLQPSRKVIRTTKRTEAKEPVEAVADEDSDDKAGKVEKSKKLKKSTIRTASPPADAEMAIDESDTLVVVDEDPRDEHDLDEAPVEAKPKRSRSTYVAIGAAVVAVGLAIALILTTTSLSSKNSADSARSSALATARTYAADVAGYSYKNLDQRFAAVEANSTPTFKRSYEQDVAALKTTLLKYHATSTAKVVAAGVMSYSGSSATILVDLNQVVTNSIEKGSTTDRTEVEMNLVNSGGKWLINNVTLL